MASPAGGEDAAGDDPGMVTASSPSPQGSVTSVKVAVRLRPLVGLETSAGCQECMFGDSDNNQVRENKREQARDGPCAHVGFAAEVFLCCQENCSRCFVHYLFKQSLVQAVVCLPVCAADSRLH